MKLKFIIQIQNFANISFYQHADSLTYIKLLAVPMLAKDVGEKWMLAKNLYMGEN